MFKIIIAIAGYYFFGFFGAIIGYFVGGSIDRARSYGIGGVNPLSAGQREAVFLETVFVLMGKLAKADGQITKDEIQHAEMFMQKMNMTAEHRTLAISQFKQGSAPDFDITATLNRFMDACGQTSNLKQVLMMYLIVMSLADGNIDAAEQSLLEKIALRLGYSQTAFKQILEMVLNQAHFASGQPPSATAVATETAKEIQVAYDLIKEQRGI